MLQGRGLNPLSRGIHFIARVTVYLLMPQKSFSLVFVDPVFLQSRKGEGYQGKKKSTFFVLLISVGIKNQTTKKLDKIGLNVLINTLQFEWSQFWEGRKLQTLIFSPKKELQRPNSNLSVRRFNSSVISKSCHEYSHNACCFPDRPSGNFSATKSDDRRFQTT